MLSHCCESPPLSHITSVQFCFSVQQFGLALSLCLSLEKVGPCLCFLAGVTWHLSLAHDVVAVYASGDACQKGHRRDRVGRGGSRVKAARGMRK